MFNTTINNTHNHDNKVESGATLNQFIITDEAAAQAFLAALVKDKKPEIPQENGIAPLNSELA